MSSVESPAALPPDVKEWVAQSEAEHRLIVDHVSARLADGAPVVAVIRALLMHAGTLLGSAGARFPISDRLELAFTELLASVSRATGLRTTELHALIISRKRH